MQREKLAMIMAFGVPARDHSPRRSRKSGQIICHSRDPSIAPQPIHRAIFVQKQRRRPAIGRDYPHIFVWPAQLAGFAFQQPGALAVQAVGDVVVTLDVMDFGGRHASHQRSRRMVGVETVLLLPRTALFLNTPYLAEWFPLLKIPRLPQQNAIVVLEIRSFVLQ